ncbi:unnamed protein product [Rotaria socialis]|uniref:Stress-response A/B barrel domain-containing protein n=2 Tax=Rotaria socialis TaxID=392032 RepID=A0A820LUG4_9BILA|nr:unnamed protein product [Rotaria socialis]CAF3439999.1 unnamed protein product [Rotaria socialis]CAF3674583.1 unnamed protein product [Rotaria socialis]CAF4200107.1 unnamed protein product [Rotaria socialis]CAF4363431.1 unnamed protein product [Rotaria socialis]
MASHKELRHVVLFKFNEGTSAEDVAKLENEFRSLATVKVSQVKGFEWGTNISKENLDHGYTHCFILTFTSEQDRDTYIDHADHVAYVAMLQPHMAAATVIDFWAQS